MKGKIFSFLSGAIVMLLLVGLPVTALAASGALTIEVNPIKVMVNGEVFQPKDAAGNDVMVFTYQGSTYAPLRALAEAYGLEVGYDAEQNIATVTNPTATPAPSAPTTQSGSYANFEDVYAGYRKAGYSKKYLAEHESDIIIHKAAKKAFDELGLKKLPTVKSLNAEYTELLAQKKAAYAEYNAAKKEMRELLIHKTNVEHILGLDNQDRTKNRAMEHER